MDIDLLRRGVARLDNVRQTVQIDFGVGDAVYPQPQVIDYPVLLTSPRCG
jgi:hypothetical protein